MGRRSPWGLLGIPPRSVFGSLGGKLLGRTGRTGTLRVAWLPLLFWIFRVVLIIAFATGEDRATRRYDRTTDVETTDPELSEAEIGTAVALELFFWILLGFLIAAILISLLT